MKEFRQDRINLIKSASYTIKSRLYSDRVIRECLSVWYLEIPAKTIELINVKVIRNGSHWVKYSVNGKTCSLFISAYLLADIKLRFLVDASKSVELSTYGTIGSEREYQTTLMSCDCASIELEDIAYQFQLNGRTICKHQIAVSKQVMGCKNLTEYEKLIQKPGVVRVAQLNQALKQEGIKFYDPDYLCGYSVKIENQDGLRYRVGYSSIQDKWFYSRPSASSNRWCNSLKDVIKAIKPVTASHIFPQ